MANSDFEKIVKVVPIVACDAFTFEGNNIVSIRDEKEVATSSITEFIEEMTPKLFLTSF